MPYIKDLNLKDQLGQIKRCCEEDNNALKQTRQPIQMVSANDSEIIQKDVLGEVLYPLVYERQPDLADVITLILLERNEEELLNLIENPEALHDRIDVVLLGLNNQEQLQQRPLQVVSSKPIKAVQPPQQTLCVDYSEIIKVVDYLNQTSSCDTEPPHIPFELLSQWTDNFKPDRLLGSGGFGDVYIGEYYGVCVPANADGMTTRRLTGRVAVKRVNQAMFGTGSVFHQSVQDGALDAMRREIRVLRAFRHPNIIKLLGFHMPEGNNPNLSLMCLVYEMASNGSLDTWLRDSNKASLLDWRQRIKIAVGIATALNYLHHFQPNHPAYHRDVKSANIGLTTDLTPKLLDCGLAKYIPAGGQQTIFTKTGAIFGTPGYMCSTYVNTIVYDAKSEIYSFGIFLSELYSGSLQNQNNVMIDSEGMEGNEIKPDVRIPTSKLLLEKFIPNFNKLCVDCIKTYKRRMPSMMNVVHSLRDLERVLSQSITDISNITDIEKEMNSLRKELEDIRLKESVETKLKRESEQKNKRECLICYDNECSLLKGVECSRGHFYCDECFRGDNFTHQICVENRGNFTKYGAKLVCQWCLSSSPHVFQDSEIASHLGAEAFSCYRKSCEEVAASQAFHEAERNFQKRLQIMRAEVEASSLANQKAHRVARHRLHIAEYILTLKCPRQNCQRAILDFDGCFAVKCDACNCYFCGWCLRDCHQSDACHQHVKQCSQAPAQFRGGYYGTKIAFDAKQGTQRKTNLEKYLRESVSVDDRNDVINAITRDISELNIVI